MKFSNLHCSNCGKKNEETTLVVSIWKGWHFEGIYKKNDGVRRLLCAECVERIREINLRKKTKKENQLTFFSEWDSAERNPEPKHSAVSTVISGHYVGLGLGENPAIDCVYYVAAYTCTARGDAFGCEECEDYKSINGDETDDE